LVLAEEILLKERDISEEECEERGRVPADLKIILDASIVVVI
jgi:hypothetical protein